MLYFDAVSILEQYFNLFLYICVYVDRCGRTVYTAFLIRMFKLHLLCVKKISLYRGINYTGQEIMQICVYEAIHYKMS